MSVSKEQHDSFPKRLAKNYMLLLKTRPLLTKSISSGIIASIANILAQIKADKINWNSVRAYGTAGVIFVGPLMHHFYIWLDQVVPKGSPNATIKRIILDRFIFAPPYLLAYFWILSILEGQGHSGAVKKIRETFLPILITNWKVWTVFQYFNINYVPQQLRVLCASMLALFWNIYVATTRK